MPANRPHIIPFLTKPVGALDWNGRVKIIPKNSNWDYCQTMEALIHCCRTGATVNIFSEGMVSNKDHTDNAQLGATAGILYWEGREYGYSEQALGTTVTQADTLLHVLHSGLDVEMDVCVASPGPDSLMLRGSVELARTLWTIYRHREHMLAHGLTGLVHSYIPRTI